MTEKIVIRAADSAVILAEPSTVKTLVFKVINKMDTVQKIVPKVTLPKNWSLVSPLFPFNLPPGDRDIILVSFRIPAGASAGRQQVSCAVTIDGEILSEASATIDIPTILDIDLQFLTGTKSLIAGREYENKYIVINNSNVENKITINVESGQEIPFVLEIDSFILQPGEVKKFRVQVKTSEGLPKKIKHYLKVSAVVEKHPDLEAEVGSYTEIIPLTTAGNVWHRLPTTIKYNSSYSKEESNLQFVNTLSFSGQGTLGTEGKHSIAFFLEPSLLPETENILEESKYSFDYWTDKYELYLGDHSHSLTKLMGGGISGLGIEGVVNFNNVSIGSYLVDTNAAEDSEMATGNYISWEFGDVNNIGAYYARKNQDEDNGIFSVDGFIRPYDMANIEFEGAFGSEIEKEYAWFLKIHGREKFFSYLFDTKHASPEFKGAITNLDYYSGDTKLTFIEDLDISAGFTREIHNYAMDPEYSSALFAENFKLGVNWKPVSGIDLSALWKNAGYKNLLVSPDYNYLREDISLDMGWKLEKLEFDLSADFHKQTNFLGNSITNSQLYAMKVNYKPTGDLSFSGNLQFEPGLTSVGILDSSTTLAIDCNYVFLENTTLNAGYKSRNYLDSFYTGYDNFNLKLGHIFQNNSRVSLEGRYNINREPEKDNSMEVSLSYSTPIQLPVSIRTDVGSVKGRVFNEDTGLGIPDIILSLGSNIAVSDENGHFTFPAVKVGDLELSLNKTRAAASLMVTRDTPIAVTVSSDKCEDIQIGMIPAAEISGIIQLYNIDLDNSSLSSDSTGKKYMPEKGVAHILLEVSRQGNDKKRVLTDRNGMFSFIGLKPGIWTLTIFEKGTPVTHKLQETKYEFNLLAGETTELEVKAMPVIRVIKMLDIGGVIEFESE